jgi:hypothetical protein
VCGGKDEIHFALARSQWFREEGAVIASELSSCEKGRDAWMIRSSGELEGGRARPTVVVD